MENTGKDIFTRIYVVLLVVMALVIVLDVFMLVLVKNNMLDLGCLRCPGPKTNVLV